jgi:hypothetical protein
VAGFEMPPHERAVAQSSVGRFEARGIDRRKAVRLAARRDGASVRYVRRALSEPDGGIA